MPICQEPSKELAAKDGWRDSRPAAGKKQMQEPHCRTAGANRWSHKSSTKSSAFMQPLPNAGIFHPFSAVGAQSSISPDL